MRVSIRYEEAEDPITIELNQLKSEQQNYHLVRMLLEKAFGAFIMPKELGKFKLVTASD